MLINLSHRPTGTPCPWRGGGTLNHLTGSAARLCIDSHNRATRVTCGSARKGAKLELSVATRYKRHAEAGTVKGIHGLVSHREVSP